MRDQNTIFTIWNWLPAFYVVAQTEHLPTASKRMHLSVSALSRTIKLLESTIGYPLFERAGRKIMLNERGRKWREAVEKIIESFSGDFEHIGTQNAARVLHVAIAGSLSQRLLAPSVVRALSGRSGGILNLYGCGDAEALALVAAGEVDVAIVRERTSAAGVTVQSLGQLAKGIYCGAEHPLFVSSGDELDAERILHHAFIGYPGGEGAGRKTVVHVQQEDTALQLCLDGQGLAALPDALADSYVARGQLRRLAADQPPSTPLHVAHRIRAAEADEWATALRAEIAWLQDAAAGTGGGSELEAQWRLGDSLVLRAEYKAALRAYTAAARTWRKQGMPRTAEVEYLLRLARVALLRGDGAGVFRLCARARASRAPTTAQRAELEALVGLCSCLRDDAPAAQKHIASARRILETIPPPVVGGAKRAWLVLHRAEGNLLLAAGRTAEAVEAYRLAVKAAAELGDRWEHSIAAFNVADALLHAGDFARALSMLDRAALQKAEMGDRWGLCHVHHARAVIHLLRASPAEALREAALGLQLAIDLADPKLTAMLNIVGGRAHLALANTDEAERAFRFGMRAAARARASAENIQARIGLAAAALGRGAVAAARRSARDARRLTERSPSKDARAAALVACAAVERRRGATAEATRLYAAASSLVSPPTRLSRHWFTVDAR